MGGEVLVQVGGVSSLTGSLRRIARAVKSTVRGATRTVLVAVGLGCICCESAPRVTFAVLRSCARRSLRRTLAVIAFAAVSLIWGSTYLGIRVALEGFPPFVIGAMRFLVAGALLFALLARARRARRRRQGSGGRRRSRVPLLRARQRARQRGRAARLLRAGVGARGDDAALGDALRAIHRGAHARRASGSGSGSGSRGSSMLNLGGEMRASGMGARVRARRADGRGRSDRSSASASLYRARGDAHGVADALRRRADGHALSVALGEHVARRPSRGPSARSRISSSSGRSSGFNAYSYLLHHTRTARGDELRVRESGDRRRSRRRARGGAPRRDGGDRRGDNPRSGPGDHARQEARACVSRALTEAPVREVQARRKGRSLPERAPRRASRAPRPRARGSARTACGGGRRRRTRSSSRASRSRSRSEGIWWMASRTP